MSYQALVEVPIGAPSRTWTWIVGDHAVEWAPEQYPGAGSGFAFARVLDCLEGEDRSWAQRQMMEIIETGEPLSFVTPVRRPEAQSDRRPRQPHHIRRLGRRP